MIPLAGKRIKLRAVEPADIDVLYHWENDPENWKAGNTISPFSRHVLEKYIETAQLDIYEAKQLRLMIERLGSEEDHPGDREYPDDPVIGSIDLFDFDPHNRRAGVGILIAKKEDRMQGFASEALSVLIDYCFGTLRLHQVYCNVSEENTASLKLFTSQGFKRTGKKSDWVRSGNSWSNVIFLQLLNPYQD